MASGAADGVRQVVLTGSYLPERVQPALLASGNVAVALGATSYASGQQAQPALATYPKNYIVVVSNVGGQNPKDITAWTYLTASAPGPLSSAKITVAYTVNVVAVAPSGDAEGALLDSSYANLLFGGGGFAIACDLQAATTAAGTAYWALYGY